MRIITDYSVKRPLFTLARRSKTVSNFAKRILRILGNVVMNMQRDSEVEQQFLSK